MSDASNDAESSVAPLDESSGTSHDRSIIVGVDGSESSVEALRYAAALAPAIGRPLFALAVWDYPPFFYGGYYPVMDWAPEDDAVKVLRAVSEAVFGDEPPAWFTWGAHQGRPAKVLIDESAGAEMLVVGSRGHEGFAALLLGSVSAACAEHAHCPVLIVHPRVAARPIRRDHSSTENAPM
jgi:nucleotide-binding universal stress UspA family protein